MLVLSALALTVGLGIWFKTHDEPTTPAASIDAAVESPAAEGPTPLVVSPSPGVGPVEPASIGRHALSAGGVPFSFRVPTSDWARFGDISINKSIVGSQGAEAIIFWTSYPEGDQADPCYNVLTPPVRPSAADLAAAVSRAPGTKLVSGPSEVTVGGRAAKRVVLTVIDDVGCDPGFFYAWEDIEGGPLWPWTEIGDTVRVWIVDVGGTLLFIEAETRLFVEAEITEQGRDLKREIQRIVESIRFA